jgi:hypothetical protein
MANGANCDDEGCGCSAPGATRACWTGPSTQRGSGKCHDGTQTCAARGTEFAVWGACEGQELHCGAPDAGTEAGTDAGTKCGCIPGSVIGCDEDCTANIFCSSYGAKTCLPDGTWGECRETMDGGLLGGLVGAVLTSVLGDGGVTSRLGIDACANVTSNNTTPDAGMSAQGLACRSLYHGCCATKMEGSYEGDCDKVFTCGHAPSP